MTEIRYVPAATAARPQMTPSDYVSPEAIRAGIPNERELSHLVSADGRYIVGVWSADPYSEYVDSHVGYEYTLVLEGRVTLTDSLGEVHSFGAGETFTIEPGWSGEYRVDDRLVKQYVSYVADEDA